LINQSLARICFAIITVNGGARVHPTTLTQDLAPEWKENFATPLGRMGTRRNAYAVALA
jgi:hypothetical protein